MEDKKFAIEFTQKDLEYPEFKRIVEKLIQAKIELQIKLGKDYFEFNETEMEFVKNRIVKPEAYDNKTKFDGEIGKLNGKRIVLVK